MRTRKQRFDASEGANKGWGPFSGGQLTVIIVAVSLVLIPTAAAAAIGSFTSTTSTAAVTGTNSSSAAAAKGVVGLTTGAGTSIRYGVLGSANGAGGIGVQGGGPRYGVYSNGPLGVASGKPLSCGGCVAPSALSAAAKNIQPLTTGQSESGNWGVASGDSTSGSAVMNLMFARPLTSNFTVVYVPAFTTTHCPGLGQADPGFLCLYQVIATGLAYDHSFSYVKNGVISYFTVSATGANANGTYTVTAP